MNSFLTQIETSDFHKTFGSWMKLGGGGGGGGGGGCMHVYGALCH